MISVKILPSVLSGAGYPYDVLANAEGWTRSIRAQGGYWMGEFSLAGDKDKLTRYFNEWLGAHVEERSGGMITWEGMIYEMDHSYAAGDTTVTRKRTLDWMYNSVICDYTLTDGTPQAVGPYTNDTSIAKYGRRGVRIELGSGQYGAAAAEAAAKRYLWEHQWPTQQPVGVDLGVGENRLTVTVCGYIYTANWRYVSVGTGSAGNVSTWINSIVTTNCDFLSAGKIDTNTLQVEPDNNTRAYDTIAEYALLGDASTYRPWRFYVGAGRKAFYEPMTTAPSYHLRGGHLYSTSGTQVERDPWRVTPGVVRDLSYPVSTAEYSGWLEDKRDFWIDEVECSTGGGLSLRSSAYSEYDTINAQASYIESIYEQRERAPWEKINVKARDWEKMSPAQRRAAHTAWRAMGANTRRWIKRNPGHGL